MSGLGKEEQDRLPRLLRQLAAPAPEAAIGTRGALTVRSVPFGEAAYDAPADRLVRALIDARILLSEGSEQNATIRLAHQHVLESWKRAKAIASANAEFYRIRDDVEDQFDRWQTSGKRRDLLIPRGLPLAEAESVAKKYPGELPMPTLSFIAASGKRARLRQRLGALALVAVFGVGVATAGELKRQADQATQLAAELTGQKNRLENQLRAAQDLAQQQFSQATANHLLSSVYVVAAIDGDKPQFDATAFAISANELATSGDVTTAIEGHESDYALLAPDGQLIMIKSVRTHPGYQQYKNYRSTLGTIWKGYFRGLDPNQRVRRGYN